MITQENLYVGIWALRVYMQADLDIPSIRHLEIIQWTISL